MHVSVISVQSLWETSRNSIRKRWGWWIWETIVYLVELNEISEFFLPTSILDVAKGNKLSCIFSNILAGIYICFSYFIKSRAFYPRNLPYGS